MQDEGAMALIAAMSRQSLNIPSQAMPTAVPPGPVILPEHWRQLAEGQRRAAGSRRAIRVARFDYCTVAIMAALSMVCGLGSSVAGLLLGIGMALVAAAEFYGAQRLRQARDNACHVLAINQLAFAAMICAYALWNIHALASAGHSGSVKELTDAGLSQEDAQNLMSIGLYDLARSLGTTLYVALIIGSILSQGGLALYYYLRRDQVRNYAEQTPAWVRQMLGVMKQL